MSEAGKVVLVTGASSGLGASTARYLCSRGMRVFGTSRRGGAGTDQAAGTAVGDGFSMLKLDVRDDDSVLRCVRSVVENTGRIDVLVNNAGCMLAGAVEETSIDEAMDEFQTNFFGAARMIRAVLPHMRDQGAGQIINIGSLGSMVGLPYMAYYSASKSALLLLSEGLRQEVRGFGVTVSVIEPGDFKTHMTFNLQHVRDGVAVYEAARRRAASIMGKNEQKGGDPVELARLVHRLVGTRRPRLVYRVGYEVFWLPILRVLAPASLFEAGVRRLYRVDQR